MAELSGVVKPKRSRRKQSELLRPFECETCFKHYATKAALSLHFKLKHEGAARTCDVVSILLRWFFVVCARARVFRRAVSAVSGVAARWRLRASPARRVS